MLILTRRLGEVVLIGDDIKFCILGVRGNQVRVGITAPDDVEILREELLLKEDFYEKTAEVAIAI